MVFTAVILITGLSYNTDLASGLYWLNIYSINKKKKQPIPLFHLVPQWVTLSITSVLKLSTAVYPLHCKDGLTKTRAALSVCFCWFCFFLHCELSPLVLLHECSKDRSWMKDPSDGSQDSILVPAEICSKRGGGKLWQIHTAGTHRLWLWDLRIRNLSPGLDNKAPSSDPVSTETHTEKEFYWAKHSFYLSFQLTEMAKQLVL